MAEIPENLQNRINHLRAEIAAEESTAALKAKERTEHEALARQQDIEANVGALVLGRTYVDLLREVEAPLVKIYDNFPRIKESWGLLNNTIYSFADNRKTAPSDEEISEMIQPTGEGWIIGFGNQYYSDDGPNDRTWSCGIDTEGQILSSFEQSVYAGGRLNGKERGIGKGIFHPVRHYGRHALDAANNRRFLDSLAWILEGNEPERRDHYSS